MTTPYGAWGSSPVVAWIIVCLLSLGQGTPTAASADTAEGEAGQPGLEASLKIDVRELVSLLASVDRDDFSRCAELLVDGGLAWLRRRVCLRRRAALQGRAPLDDGPLTCPAGGSFRYEPDAHVSCTFHDGEGPPKPRRHDLERADHLVILERLSRVEIFTSHPQLESSAAPLWSPAATLVRLSTTSADAGAFLTTVAGLPIEKLLLETAAPGAVLVDGSSLSWVGSLVTTAPPGPLHIADLDDRPPILELHLSGTRGLPQWVTSRPSRIFGVSTLPESLTAAMSPEQFRVVLRFSNGFEADYFYRDLGLYLATVSVVGVFKQKKPQDLVAAVTAFLHRCERTVHGGDLVLSGPLPRDSIGTILATAASQFSRVVRVRAGNEIRRLCARARRPLERAAFVWEQERQEPAPQDLEILVRLGLLERVTRCPAGGVYRIDRDGTVRCSLHD